VPVARHGLHRLQFDRVVQQRSGAVGVKEVRGTVAADPVQHVTEGEALGIGAGEMRGVRRHRESLDPQGARCAGGIRLEANRRRTLAHEKSTPAYIEWPATNLARRKQAESLKAAEEQRVDRRFAGDHENSSSLAVLNHDGRADQGMKAARARGRDGQPRAFNTECGGNVGREIGQI